MTITAQNYAVGSLVHARGREWVVLPESSGELLVLQPLGGASEEIAGVFLPVEGGDVKPATFAFPDPQQSGDARSSFLLREAARLGFRSGAGPFRSFGRIAVEPRPYQIVPLLLALQLDPIRLLIADDVGIGKTVEAALIARELLDRGEISRMTVLCPPHLAQQWARELSEKFHLEAEVVLPSTSHRLERVCGPGESLFDHYPHTVVSLDFIKTERRRDEFLRACGEFVIVDEAHTCTQSFDTTRQQRHRLLLELSKTNRHIVLVTATPHSGNEGAFRSLLSVLRPDFSDLPDDLSGTHNAHLRREVAKHLVQRRRGDIARYLDADTPFPTRDETSPDIGYSLSPAYKKFFDKVLAYARESVQTDDGSKFRQRVRWWSALSLLRALASSPAAAAATLRSRAAAADATDAVEADAIGRAGVLDLSEDAGEEAADLAPGAVWEELPSPPSPLPQSGRGENGGLVESGREAHNSQINSPSPAPRERGLGGEGQTRRLQEMAREAETLFGAQDRKLKDATDAVRELLNDGFSPIVFCRFVNTAQYVADHFRSALKGVEVEAVTGLLPPDERQARVLQLAEATRDGKRRVLVATDCLSEGINLQTYFDAVLHYDLSWNPTRHEQREGRVDRYGQAAKTVRVKTLYGVDNQIDGLVLEVLLKKHRSIRKALGVSVPVPAGSDAVVNAILEGLLLRGNSSADQLSMFDDDFKLARDQLHAQWDGSEAREKRSRTVFSHEGVKPEDVAREIEAMRQALGGQSEIETFVRQSLSTLGVTRSQAAPLRLVVKDLPEAIRENLSDVIASSGKDGVLLLRFAPPVSHDEILVGRTHPLVSSLASFLLETALDSQNQNPVAARCGAFRTDAVSSRTTLLLLRGRFHITSQSTLRDAPDDEKTLLAEDVLLLAFRGSPEAPEWLSREDAELLLRAEPTGNYGRDLAANAIQTILNGMNDLGSHLENALETRAAELDEAHGRVRDATKARRRHRVAPQLPADVLGVWVLLPPLKD